MISKADYKQLQTSGRSTELVQRQYEFLTRERPPLFGICPAHLGDGIQRLSENEKKEALDNFNTRSDESRWMKFVPASGAASRMFASLHIFLKATEQPDFDLSTYWKSAEGIPLSRLHKELKKLPFFGLINAKLMQENGAKFETTEIYFQNFIRLTIAQFESYPKALIPFFIDDQGQEWTPFEAQLSETIHLGHQKSPIPLHLTIDKNHRELFDQALEKFQLKQTRTDKQMFYVEYSHQNRLTDTPFIDSNKTWIRDKEGAIAFRKGGHGSLLENVNHLDTDYLWIKNVDNILLGDKNSTGELWMKILAGKLLSIQERIFSHLKILEERKEKTTFEPIQKFIQNNFDPNFNLKSESKMSHEVLFDYLHRPLRVCGMIPNLGAIGGGPFWKKTTRGKSLQIIEGVELDNTLEEHSKAIATSTHFNPVMMVCGITDYLGEKFSLLDFRDEKRYMISQKKDQNKNITILEWPGLWNGGMAEWNSVFVELPPETFNPVKSIMDLL